MLTRSSAPVRLSAVAALTIIVGACSATPAVSPLRTTAPLPTVFATPTAIRSPVASMAAGPIAEGTYRSQAVPVSSIVARINADTTLTAAEKANATKTFAGHPTQTIELTFSEGQFTASETFDSGQFEVGARATYAFPDSHTLVIQEQCCGISTFDLTTAANSFTLKYRVGAPNAGEDAVGQTVYELRRFTAVP
jgi:hypothetical protein